MFITLVSPQPKFPQHESILGPWFDSGRQKLLYASEGSFYWFDPFCSSLDTATVHIHGPMDLRGISMARVSLDDQMIAAQKSSTEVVVFSLQSAERWALTIKHPEDNEILSPGIVWSEHGGKSQDLVILTRRGLELYKASLLRGQCKLSRAMAQRTTRYLYEPVHRVLLLPAPTRYIKGSLEVHAFFLRFDALTDMPR